MNLASWVALAFCVVFLVGLCAWFWRDWVRTSSPPKRVVTGGRVGIQLERGLPPVSPLETTTRLRLASRGRR